MMLKLLNFAMLYCVSYSKVHSAFTGAILHSFFWFFSPCQEFNRRKTTFFDIHSLSETGQCCEKPDIFIGRKLIILCDTVIAMKYHFIGYSRMTKFMDTACFEG